MPMHRKNKAPRTSGRHARQDWFNKHVKRQRMRRDMAILSKRKNRK